MFEGAKMKKIIITFIIAVLFLPLYGCIENNNQSIDNSNIKNNSYSIYSIEDLTNEIWKMANAKCEGIDIFHPSVEISEDQKTITWKIAIDDFGVAAEYVAVNNSDENMESWNTTLIADAVEMSKISKEKAKSFGFNDVDMEVQLVDSDDVDSPIIYAKNGKLEYDFVKDFSERIKKTTENNSLKNNTSNVSSMTKEQTNALNQAKRYLTYSSFSYSGLIKQLDYEGYSNEAATYAVDNCDVDWNEQAAKMANSYLSYSSFSKEKLIEQLEYEGFTREQAEFGVSQAGY